MPNTNDATTVKKGRGGPLGLGDPDDTSLRKTEKNLIIPQMRRKMVNEEKCPQEIAEYQDCVCKAGLMLAGFKCKELKLRMADCMEYWNEDEELQARAKRMYLEERKEFRRTGVCKQNREYINQYLDELKGKQTQ